MKTKKPFDWKSVPVKVTGNPSNASRLLGAAVAKYASSQWKVESGKLKVGVTA